MGQYLWPYRDPWPIGRWGGPVHADDLPKYLTIIYEGNDRSSVRLDPALKVGVRELRAAFAWLLCNNWLWMEATRHIPITSDFFGADLEGLLQSYASASAERQVPVSLVQTATSAGSSSGCSFAAGPADAVASDSEGENQPPSSTAAEAPSQATKLPFSAAVLEASTENMSVIQEWDAILKNYRVSELITTSAEDVTAKGQNEEQRDTDTERLAALAEATAAFGRLAQKDVREALKLWEVHAQGDGSSREILRETLIPVDSFSKDFWAMPFVDLFPRCDCMERDPCRTHGAAAKRDHLRGKPWAQVLLSRADYRGWARSKAFVACLFNILYRREQYGAIKMVVLHSAVFQRHAPVLARITAQQILTAAVEAGDAHSIRELLRKSNLHADVETLAMLTQTVCRNIAWSDAARSAVPLVISGAL